MTIPVLASHGHPVIIVGAGRGGSALLDMFLEDELVSVIAMVDPNPQAKGLQAARQQGIPTYANITEALHCHRQQDNCLIYNLTHDDTIIDEVAAILGPNPNVTGGMEAKILWQMVTRLRQTKQELEKNQAELQAIIQNATDGIITVNESCEIQGFNPAAEAIFGYRKEEIRGYQANQLIPHYFPPPTIDGSLLTLPRHSHEGVGVRKNGQTFPVEISLSEMALSDQRYFVGIVRDITERKETQERIQFMAHHDFLTQLSNRVLFQDRLEHSLALAQRNKSQVGLLLIDLDGFKQVNDTLGHDQGDLLLVQVAERLRLCARKSDTIARLGGDEFAIILGDIQQPSDAQLVAALIVRRLAQTFTLAQPWSISCSLGIALAPQDADTPTQLIKHADEAMYCAKQNGKGQFVFWKASNEGS